MRWKTFLAVIGATVLAGCSGRTDPNTAAQLEQLQKDIAELRQAIKQLPQNKPPTGPTVPNGPAVLTGGTSVTAAPKKWSGTTTLKNGEKRNFTDLSGLRWKVISTINYQ